MGVGACGAEEKKGGQGWLFAQKPFDPPNRPKPPQTPNFPEIRRCPEIPQEFQQLKKGVFGKGSFRNLCAELCFVLFCVLR